MQVCSFVHLVVSLPGFLLLGSCHVQRMVLSHNPVANAAYIRPWRPSMCMHIHTPFLSTHTLSCSLSLYLNASLFQNSVTKLTCSLAAVYWTHWHFISGMKHKIINSIVAVQLQQKTTTFCMWNGLLLDSYLMTSNW